MFKTKGTNKPAMTRKQKQLEKEQARLALVAFNALESNDRSNLDEALSLEEDRLHEAIDAEVEQARENLKETFRELLAKYRYAAVAGCIEQRVGSDFTFESVGLNARAPLCEVAFDLWLDTYITTPGEFDPDAEEAKAHGLVLGSSQWVKFNESSHE
jgi:hypothetical protein